MHDYLNNRTINESIILSLNCFILFSVTLSRNLYRQTICDNNCETEVAVYLYSIIAVILRFSERLQD